MQEAVHHLDGLAHEALVIHSLLRVHGVAFMICNARLAGLVMLGGAVRLERGCVNSGVSPSAARRSSACGSIYCVPVYAEANLARLQRLCRGNDGCNQK